MGELEKVLARLLTNVRNRKEVIAEARNEGKTVHFASLMDVCHLKKIRSWSHSFRNTKVELFSEVTLRKMIQHRMHYFLSKDHRRHQ